MYTYIYIYTYIDIIIYMYTYTHTYMVAELAARLADALQRQEFETAAALRDALSASGGIFGYE